MSVKLVNAFTLRYILTQAGKEAMSTKKIAIKCTRQGLGSNDFSMFRLLFPSTEIAVAVSTDERITNYVKTPNFIHGIKIGDWEFSMKEVKGTVLKVLKCAKHYTKSL